MVQETLMTILPGQTVRTTAKESLGTSRAISRFFERFYCPTVMIIRDRSLEKRAESRNIRTVWNSNPAEDLAVLSSDLNCIKLKEKNSGYQSSIESSEYMTFDTRPETHGGHQDQNGPFAEQISSMELDNQERHFVDLMSDEPKGTWKQTIIKRFCVEEDSKDTSLVKNAGLECFRADPRTKMTESVSKSHRDSGSSSLTTALKDRAACVIPVQPNHSLPIRPIPPVPMRSSAIPKTLILKLSKPLIVDTDDDDLPKSISAKANGDRELKIEERSQRIADACAVSPESVSSSTKRKVNERAAAEKHVVKDSKKRRKSQEGDFNQVKEDRVKEVLESSRKHQNNVVNKNAMVSRELSMEQAQGSSVNSNGDVLEKERDGNKTVPPLRLKKVVREVRTIGDDCDMDNISATTEVELNYRIVTGATPVPTNSANEVTRTSPSWSTTEMDSDDSHYDPPGSPPEPQENSVHLSPAKKVGFKVKCRRNRLKQKLRELRNKRQNLDEQMSREEEKSPQQTTRLRQMMNCIEKQMENVSKLLDKLSAPAEAVEDPVDIAEGVPRANHETTDSNGAEKVNKSENSPTEYEYVPSEFEIISPEPPKLSPSTPLDYEQKKSPSEVMDSPPVLARICLTIPPNLDGSFEKQIPSVEENIWKEREQAPLPIPFNLPEVEGADLSAAKIDIIAAGQETVSTANVSIINSGDSNLDPSEEVVIVNSVNVVDGPNEHGQTIKTKREPAVEQIESLDMPCVSSNVADFDILRSGIDQTVQPGGNEIQAAHSMSSDLNVPIAEPDVRHQNNVPYESIGSTGQHSQQVSVRPVTNPPQIQPSSYNPNENQNNVLMAGPVENPRNVQRQLNNGNNSEMRRNETSQGCGNNQIILEQFPTLGNWVRSQNNENFRRSLPRARHKPAEASTSGTAEGTARVSGSRKTPKTLTRNNGIGVKFRVETERCHGYQEQIDQQVPRPSQQILQQSAADSTYQPLTTTPTGSGTSVGLISSSTGPSAGPSNGPPTGQPTGPSAVSSTVSSTVPLLAPPAAVANPSSYPQFCPPMSAASFYPANYSVDAYGNTTFGYHSPICTYNNYQCHPQLHPTLNGLHLAMPEAMQNIRPDSTRYYSTEMTKYSSMNAGTYTHPNVVDFERCRALNAARNNTNRGIQPILIPSSSALPSSTQQSLPQPCVNEFPGHNGQYNRITSDMVAAAAAAAVAAAASLGQQRSSLPPYNRQECDRGTAVVDLTSEEPSHMVKNLPNNTHERLPSSLTQSNVPIGLNQDSQQNRSGTAYHNLQNLMDTQGNRMNVDRSYGPGSSFSREVAATSTTSSEASRYQAPIVAPPENCPTPYLERINRVPNMYNAIQCSNCGQPGCCFKCVGCETAFYCNERCQALHWAVHCQKCPKKMPKLKKVL